MRFYVKKSIREVIALIFIPGGEGSRALRNAITENSLRNIVTYVQNGGRFGGACAGAALMAQNIIYHLPDQLLTITHCDGTFLFPGTAYGPALDLYNPDHTHGSARCANFEWASSPTESIDPSVQRALSARMALYWNGGCVFALPSATLTDACTTCFRYADPIYGPTADQLARANAEDFPAIIIGQHGNGHYILFGPHPELMPSLFDVFHSQIGLTVPGLNQLSNYWQLLTRWAPRQATLVLAYCLHRLGLRVRNWEQFIVSDI